MQYEQNWFLKVNLKTSHSKFCSSPLSCPSVCHLKSPLKTIGPTRLSTNCTCPVFGINQSVPQPENILQGSIFPVVPEITKSLFWEKSSKHTTEPLHYQHMAGQVGSTVLFLLCPLIKGSPCTCLASNGLYALPPFLLAPYNYHPICCFHCIMHPVLYKTYYFSTRCTFPEDCNLYQ